MATGTSTSEFKISALALPVIGLLLIAGALFAPMGSIDPGQRSQLLLGGLGLVGVGGGSYAVSRGIAKIGSAAPAPTEDEAAKKVAELK